MTPSTNMAKKRTVNGSAPQFHATVPYKLWVRRTLAKKDWSLQRFVAAIKRADPNANASTGGISQFLGREDQMPEPSNTTLIPAINRALGAAPPPLCNPDDELAQLHDRLAARWKKMTARERQALLALLDGDD